MADQTIKIVLSATGDAQVAGAAQRAAKGLDQLDAAQKKVGISAGQQAAAMRALPAQLTDIAVGLSSGQAPLTVFLQQGGQLKDMFGGAGAAAKAVGGAVLGLLSPINLAVAAVAALGYAAYQGAQESDALANSLRTTGGYAGQTAGQLESLTQRLQVATGSSIGNVRELTAALVGTGQFGPQSLGEVVSAMARVQSLTGQTADQVVKDFSGMSSGVAKWAAEHNKQYHFLSVAQFARIQQLEKQGKLEEAMRTTASALDGALAARAPQLGLLERAWKALGTAASQAWDDMKGIGRAETVEQQIAKVQAQLTANARRTDRADSIGPNGKRRGADSQAAELQAQLESLQELQRMQNRAATQQSEQAQKDQSGITKLMDNGAQQRAMQTQLATLQEQLRLRQEIYKAGEAEIDNLQKSGVINELQATTQKAAIRARSVDDERETIEQRLAILRRYSDTEKDQAAAQGEVLVLSVRAQAQAAQSQAAIQQEAYQRFAAGQEAYSKVVDSMRSLTDRVRDANANSSIGLIADPQVRALAQFRQDIAQLEREIADQRRKGTFDLIGGDELQRQYDQTRELLGEKLAQSLKPEWQVLVESWKDTTRLMREASEEMTTGFVRSAEDAWVKTARTGKLSLNSLRDEITNTFLRTVYRDTLAGPAATAGKALSGLLFGARGKAKDDSTDKLAGAAEQAASSLEKASTSGNIFGSLVETAGKYLTSFGDTVLTAARSLVALVTSLSASNSSSSAMGILALVGAASSGSSGTGSGWGGGGGDAAGVGTGLAASGAWFSRGAANFLGGVRAFAQGGAFTNSIVNSPTHFRFAHGGGFGLGLMGEAGPEAIMPLRRARNGALGVVASGGASSINANFDFSGMSIGAGVSTSQVSAAVSLAVDAAQARFVENMQRGNRAFQPPRS